ncbi:S8 family peptidase [Anaeromicropila populeti]|uniref:Subtilase family protein n=1 Tax=Anaeromicropila populeti TaxID=37658 RepID=A0A1I6HIN5_9FIRM|nr:S8 family peptidase [Anaeromicropila populeti]SFR54224.1 Subtilase family protein [Anaeromicropila populeti]
MKQEDRKRIYSQEYADLIIEYNVSGEELLTFEKDPRNFIDEKYAVIYFPNSKISEPLVNQSGYYVIPKLFGLVETSSLEEIGVTKIQNIPYLSLRGQDVLLGFIDTGIEYTNPLFQYSDNTTRIVSIWDQSIPNLQATDRTFYYGTEYTREQINEALQSDDPLSIVPSTDEIGHGTALAGLAGGSRLENENFAGVAPAAEYVIVKLKPAKETLRNFFLIPEDAICYQENDIMFGLQYLFNMARRLKKPIAICIGLGTNQGSHGGTGVLSDMINTLSDQVGIAITIAGGNEGNSGHHFYGEVDKSKGYTTVELKVGENEQGFSMELWGGVPGTYSIDMLSPTGQYVPRIPATFNEHRVISFLFENTTVIVDYLLLETQSGDQLILLRFKNSAPGIWRFNVYSGPISSGFHIWLPMRGFISDQTFFVNPNPDTTITNPGNAMFAITVVPYDHTNKSIYIYSSRGYSRTGVVKPELAAPGVNVYTPALNNQFQPQSGSSIAAAFTAGVTAMLLEWGIVKGNDRGMDTVQTKKYLIRGVKRMPNVVYPNKEWGYGMLDVYGIFISLRGEG